MVTGKGIECTETSADKINVEDITDEEFSTFEEERINVKEEMTRIRKFVANLSMDDPKSGDRFAKLLAFSRNPYVTQVDADYSKRKYPNLAPEAMLLEARTVRRNTRIAFL